jgi:hypothetical protein
MEELKKLAENFMQLNEKNILFRAMVDNPQLEKLAVKLNQKQLQDGKTANDRNLPNYSKTSVEVYGKEPGPMTLKDTGDFYDSFDVILLEDGFVIDADSLKTDALGGTTDLFIKYGQDITGLNDENLSIFVEALIPKVQEAILKLIFR